MKRFLIGSLTAGAVAAMTLLATNAFFSDTEVSKDNTFTAGKVDLLIDATTHYDGMVCTNVAPTGQTNYIWVEESTDSSSRPELIGDSCTGTWPEKDLVAEKFYDFTDVKPGDSGETTISIHVDDNPVWMCLDINNMKNLENDLIDPESEAEDTTKDDLAAVPPVYGGELAQNLHFTAWQDNNCDNIWNNEEEILFSNTEGPASDVLGGKTYTLYAPSINNGVAFPGNSTKCVAVKWCAGTMDVDDVNFEITCDGVSMGNEAQTDSLTADVGFRVEQSRNNPNFTCERQVLTAP